MVVRTIVIGFTRSDRAAGYSSYTDGYRPDAVQDTHEFEVNGPVGLTGTQWAEAVYVASNAPAASVIAGQPGGTAAYLALTGLAGSGVRLRSLSTGDTVTVDGVMYACAATGWEVVA